MALDVRPTVEPENVLARVIELHVHPMRIHDDTLGRIDSRWKPQDRAVTSHQFEVQLQIRGARHPILRSCIETSPLEAEAYCRHFLTRQAAERPVPFRRKTERIDQVIARAQNAGWNGRADRPVERQALAVAHTASPHRYQ